LKRLAVPFAFCIVAGLTIALTSAFGHVGIAALEFPCAIVFGALLFFRSSRAKAKETTVGNEKTGKSNKLFRWFGWVLLFGVLLQIYVRVRLTAIYHRPFGSGPVIEYVIELALAWFLMMPGKNNEN
jgi:hypothetical protein